jgi:hypothetical protein
MQYCQTFLMSEPSAAANRMKLPKALKRNNKSNSCPVLRVSNNRSHPDFGGLEIGTLQCKITLVMLEFCSGSQPFLGVSSLDLGR